MVLENSLFVSIPSIVLDSTWAGNILDWSMLLNALLSLFIEKFKLHELI